MVLNRPVLSLLFLFLLFAVGYAQPITITPKNPPIAVQLDATGNYQVKLDDIATIISNSAEKPTVSFSPQSFNCKNLGPQFVTVTVTNGAVKPSNPLGASFFRPFATVFDHKGNLFVTDEHCIRKIDPDGNVSLFAGEDVTVGYPYGQEPHEDGPALSARFVSLSGIAIDDAGNLYLTDRGANEIRKIDASGMVSTLAGDIKAGHVDGVGNAARFSLLWGIAIDKGSNLYVTENDANDIRKITPDGTVTTFAGNGELGYIDAKGTAARFRFPMGICADSSGNLYVADGNNVRVRKITPDGEVTTLAGNDVLGSVDGRGAEASFTAIESVAVDASGTIYAGDANIRKITADGVVTTLAGTDDRGLADGKGALARFVFVESMSFDACGYMYATDPNNYLIRKVSPDGIVATFAGTGKIGNRDGNIGTLQTADCPVQAVIPVLVEDPAGTCKINTVVAVNTFTPNGDGVNDVWNLPALSNYPDCTVMVYNRYGQAVFTSTGYSKPWDGSYNGSALPAGAYYYIIKLGASNQNISGTVTILK